MKKELDHYGQCPKCGTSWDGGSIITKFQEMRDKGDDYWKHMSNKDIADKVNESYSPPYRFSKLIPIEARGMYDRASFWKCPKCKKQWDRFTGEEVKDEE